MSSKKEEIRSQRDDDTAIKLSICIPTYNRLPYLKNCLFSIYDTMKDYPFEIIIADGGSTDGTVKYLKNLDKIKLVEQRKLTGITKAYNACFKKARGEYVFVGNDDMIIQGSVFIKLCSIMDGRTNFGLIAPKDIEPQFHDFPATTLKLKRYYAVMSKFHIVRMDLLREIGYFDEHLYSYYTDDDLCLSVLSKGYYIGFSKKPGIVHFRAQDKDTNIARKINFNMSRLEGEQKYMEDKWSYLTDALRHYTKNYVVRYKRAFLYGSLCDRIYHSDTLFRFVSKDIYDKLLEKCVVFSNPGEDAFGLYDDLYLVQGYPSKVVWMKK